MAYIAQHHKKNGVGKEKTRLEINVQNQKSVYGKIFQILQKDIYSERNVTEFPQSDSNAKKCILCY